MFIKYRKEANETYDDLMMIGDSKKLFKYAQAEASKEELANILAWYIIGNNFTYVKKMVENLDVGINDIHTFEVFGYDNPKV